MLIYSKYETNQIMGQQNTFCRHATQESSCKQKETAGIDILTVRYPGTFLDAGVTVWATKLDPQI